MTNFEKVKEMITIEDFIRDDSGTFMCEAIEKMRNKKCDHDYDSCQACWKWLSQEYVEPILDYVEREYLSALIKPFRDRIKCIYKIRTKDYAYIYIKCKESFDNFSLPQFEINTMYKGMKFDKEYTLEELGL